MRSETDSGESETKSNVRCGKVLSDAAKCTPPTWAAAGGCLRLRGGRKHYTILLRSTA